jgi:hypothetical protein
MKIKPLTEKDREILHELVGQTEAGVEWVRPMNLGARDGSDHSHRLLKMERYGFVEKKRYGSSRSYQYRATIAGRALDASFEHERIQKHRELLRIQGGKRGE